MSTKTLSVGNGVELAYIDSGAPPGVESYTTILAIHGFCFSNHIFDKLKTVAFCKGYRLVSISRRAYPGSTGFGDEDIKLFSVPQTDDADKRAAFVKERGHELAVFIDTFAQEFKLPAISLDGQNTGGIIVLGWSMGSALAVEMLAHTPSLSTDVRTRLATQLRSVVLYEPPPGALGLSDPPQMWVPMIDTTIPEESRLPMFTRWVSGYFDHSDYSARDYDKLEYINPAIDKAPSIYNLSPNERRDILDCGAAPPVDLPQILFLPEQLKASFQTAFGSPEIDALFPKLKRRYIIGSRSGAFAFVAMWHAQTALEGSGTQNDVMYKIVNGINHFVHWDCPEKALELIVE